MCISSLRFSRFKGDKCCCGLGRTTNSFENHNIYLIISSFRPAESRQRPQMRAKIPPGPPSAPDVSPRSPLGHPMSPQGAPRTPQCPPKDRPRIPNAKVLPWIPQGAPRPIFEAKNEPKRSPKWRPNGAILRALFDTFLS